MESMHAVAITGPLPVSDPECFVDVDLPIPEPGPHDLLVEVQAVSVNPIDIKLRKEAGTCLLYTSPSPRDLSTSRMPSSA